MMRRFGHYLQYHDFAHGFRRGAGLAVAALLLTACAAPHEKSLPAAAPASAFAAQLTADQREAAVAHALLLVNTPYTWGGNTPQSGFDCSGLVHYVFDAATQGRQSLPRTTAQWAADTRLIADNQLQRGDLVFFNTSGKPHSHMGIYVGDGQFVHAPSSGGVVHKSSLSNPYFKPRYEGARRVLQQ